MWIKWFTNTLLSPQDRGPDHTVPVSSLPYYYKGSTYKSGGGRLIHTLSCHARPVCFQMQALTFLCFALCYGGKGVTEEERLHFPAPLLAGSQPGLVLGERQRKGGKENSRYLSLLLLRAVSLEWTYPLHCSVLVGPSLFSWFQLVPCGSNPGMWLPKVVFLA